MLIILYCLIAGFLGVIAHIISKYQGLKSTASKLNSVLSFSQFLKEDWAGMVLATIPVFGWLFINKEIAVIYPKIAGFVYTSFFLVGLSGSYLIQKATSVSKKKIDEIADIKSNISDGVDSVG